MANTTDDRDRFHVTAASPTVSHLQGFVTCSYADLVQTFGNPNSEGDGYKVSTEWVIYDRADDLTITIYDWKCTELYDDYPTSVEEFRAQQSYEWHIGCSSKPDVVALAAFIRAHTGNPARARTGNF